MLAYRRAVHPSTGRYPAILIFGLQIQSRLDLIVPKLVVEPDRLIPKRQFSEGDNVMVREYLYEDKWRTGKITRQ